MIISAKSGKVFETIGFQNEKKLQDTIERLPSLLNTISQLNQQDYPLLILKRGFGVSSGSLDFLAVDVDGSLYIIETKLAENPEIRRKIIGQILEYASNLSDMTYDILATESLRYLKKQKSLEQVIHDFYAAKSSDELVLSAGEYKKTIADNLKNRRFSIVVIANKVNFEIQKLFHFLDQETKDNLNFLVLEINKYHLDSEEVFHSGVVWAAKYIKALFSRIQIDEQTYLASKSLHVQELIKHIDSWCQAKGLSKTANTKGLSWKHMNKGSILVSKDNIKTNWSTLHNKSQEMDEFKETVMRKAKKAGFVTSQTKHGVLRLKLDDNTRVEDVDRFIELAYSVLQKADELAKRSSQ